MFLIIRHHRSCIAPHLRLSDPRTVFVTSLSCACTEGGCFAVLRRQHKKLTTSLSIYKESEVRIDRSYLFQLHRPQGTLPIQYTHLYSGRRISHHVARNHITTACAQEIKPHHLQNKSHHTFARRHFFRNTCCSNASNSKKTSCAPVKFNEILNYLQQSLNESLRTCEPIAANILPVISTNTKQNPNKMFASPCRPLKKSDRAKQIQTDLDFDRILLGVAKIC